jgi:hypothetical protein
MAQFSVKIMRLTGSLLGENQHPRRRDDMRGDPATQIDPLDLPEFVIRQDGGELQWLIKSR